MRLTVEEHGDRLKRFGHLDRASRFGGRRCGETFKGSSRTCTRCGDHRGPHVAHGFLGKVLAVWEDGPAVPKPTDEARATAARARGNRVVRGEETPGIVARAWRRAVKVLSSPEELALILLFLGLVAWGVEVALRILAGW